MTRTRAAVFFVLLAAAAFALRSRAFEAGFAFDDFHTIEQNPAIREATPISKFFTKGSEWFSTLASNRTYRPLTTLSYAFDYARAGKLDPAAFHQTTFVLALLEALLLYALARRAYAALVAGSDGRVFALACVALRFFHGAQPETLNYHSARSDVASTLFVLAGLWVHASFPRARIVELGAIVASVGLFAKEPAATYPAILGLWVLFVERGGLGAALRRALPALLVHGGVFYFTRTMQGAALDFGKTVPLHDYLATQAWILVRYVGFFFAPLDASIDHERELVTSLLDPRFLVGGALLLSLLAAIAFLRGPRGRLVAFGVAWFLVALLPSSSLQPLHEMRNDHRVYYPFLGAILAVVAAGAAVLSRVTRWADAAGEGRAPRRVAAVLFAVFVAAHAAWAARRDAIWVDGDRLWEEALKTSPNNARVWMNAGLGSLRKGATKEALERFERARDLEPRYPLVHVNLGVAHDALGDREASEAAFAEAASLAPKDWRVPFWRGDRLLRRGAAFEAAAAFRHAKELNRKDLSIRVALAKALAAADLPVALYEIVDESEELFPNDAELAAVAATYPEPIRTAARAARTAPPSAEKYALLSAAAYRAGRFQTAVGAARLATEIDRACLIGWINLGAALGALERFEEEIEACRVALKLDPTNALAARNLAWAESRVKETATRPAAK